jgi:hypothetical protein
VTSPKTLGSIRRVNLSPETMEVLRTHRAVIAEYSLKAGRPMPETVFVNEAGKPMDASKVSKAHEIGLRGRTPAYPDPRSARDLHRLARLGGGADLPRFEGSRAHLH